MATGLPIWLRRLSGLRPLDAHFSVSIHLVILRPRIVERKHERFSKQAFGPKRHHEPPVRPEILIEDVIRLAFGVERVPSGEVAAKRRPGQPDAAKDELEPRDLRVANDG